MLRRGLAICLLAISIVGVAYADETDTAQAPYEGYCEHGKPVVIRWDPALDEFFRPACVGDKLSLEQHPITIDPNIEPEKYPDPPVDWSAWVGIWLNNLAIANPYKDVVPYTTASTGRTLIPIRMVTEAMGGSATWDQATQRVTIRLNDKYMEMTIGKPEAIANGEAVVLDQPPLIWLDRTLVPLRVVVEAFGAQVNWTHEIRRVDIFLPGVECQPGYCVDWL